MDALEKETILTYLDDAGYLLDTASGDENDIVARERLGRRASVQIINALRLLVQDAANVAEWRETCIYQAGETQGLQVELDSAQEQILELRYALETVEWVDGKCPWCDGWNPETYTTGPRLGHSEGCERQTALRGEQ